MALTDKLVDIADAIRSKTGTTATMTLAEMPTKIINIKTGVELNFKVVGGTTEPSNPTENTIWVNTDTEITSWIFSSTEPENPVEGMVWFSTGTSSSVAFNALKKNGITVYPLSAKQLIGGVWKGVTAKSSHDGQWVDWMIYLYNKGAEYVDESGNGWVFSGKYTQNEDSIRVGTTGGTAFSGYAESPFINMSGFDTIDIHIITFTTSGPECYGTLYVIDEGGTTVIEHSLTRGMADDSLVNIDVSSINSRCKFRVTAGHTRTGSGRSSYIDFDVVRCY